MTEKNKMVFTHKQPKREVVPGGPKGGGFLSVHQLRDGKLSLSPSEYCNRFAKDEEWKILQGMIVERRKSIPAFSFWKCPACGYRTRLDGEAIERYRDDPISCLNCNRQRFKDGGFLIEMTRKEIKELLKDEEAAATRSRERLIKAGLFDRNEERKKAGLEPLTMKQYTEEQNRAYRESIRRSQGGQK